MNKQLVKNKNYIKRRKRNSKNKNFAVCLDFFHLFNSVHISHLPGHLWPPQFVFFYVFFLPLLVSQMTFTTVHTTDHALKFFPHHITCCHLCTSSTSTWNSTWSKSRIQQWLALLSLHPRVEHSWPCKFIFLTGLCIHSCTNTPYPQWLPQLFYLLIYSHRVISAPLI